MNKYRYIIVEDEDLISQNVYNKIESLSLPLQYCGRAEDGEKALTLIDETNPQIVLTDIKMPVMDGLMLSKELHFAYPQIKIIIISGYDEFNFAKQAIQYGVSAFLLKPLDLSELRSSLCHIAAEIEAADASLQKDNHLSSEMNREEIADYIETFLRNNYGKNISIGEIADSLGLTPDYLSRLYKKERKMTPIHFVTMLRINEAKRLLISSNYDMNTIAQMVGYTDQFYFSRVFNMQTGISPSEYRNQNKANNDS
ncbi:MAG: response regulator [Lachnospiraceae bacterium]|jgi:two-component system response regulator YesN|nr:response regulator [Lachnospiraceae bacterium]